MPGLVINFGNYKYVDPYNTTQGVFNYNELDDTQKEQFKQYKFDLNEYDRLMKEKRDLAAISYASKFQFLDTNRQREFRASLNQQRHQAEVYDAIYQKARRNGGKQAEAMEFIDDFEHGTFNKDNGFAKEWQNYFKALGSRNGNTDGDNYASRIKLDFHKEQRTLFGINAPEGSFLDVLVRDNKNTAENFIKELSNRTNLSEQELKNIGVEFNNGTSIEFNKDIDWKVARTIIELLGDQHYTKGFHNATFLTGINEKGEDVSKSKLSVYNTGGLHDWQTRVWTFKGNRLSDGDIKDSGVNDLQLFRESARSSQYLANMEQLVSYSKSQRDKFFDDIADETHLYESYVGAPLGNRKEDGYLKERAANAILGTAGTPTHYDFYATVGWEPKTDTRKKKNDNFDLELLDNNERSKVYSWLRNALRDDIDNVIIRKMYVAGMEGVVFNYAGKSKDGVDYAKPFEVFIPGIDIGGEPIDDALNTYINATKTVNLMHAYGSDHTMDDGTILSPNEDGESFSLYSANENGKKGELITNYIHSKDAKNLINIDYVTNESASALYEKYNTIDDYNANRNEFERMVQILAMNGANEMFENTPILKQDGEQYTPEELINMMDENGDILPEYRNLFNEDGYNKILAFYRLYNKIGSVRNLYR